MGNIKALLVGVSKYSFVDNNDLPFCVNDVNEVKKALIEGLNALESNIMICGNKGIVNYNDLINGLASFYQNCNEDIFIFYFSGHGGSDFLALSDQKLQLQSLIEALENIPTKNKIIILDSCYSGNARVSNTRKEFYSAIDDFVGGGCAVLASCGAEQTSSFEDNRKLSIYTSFLVDALTSRFLIREGEKSLESINELIIALANNWNNKNPLRAQTPIFRSNIIGTIFFDVEEYKSYKPKKISKETDEYILKAVYSSHTAQAKRLLAKVILRHKCSNEEIADISKDIKNQIMYEDVYKNSAAEAKYKGKPANIIWCYFGYSEDDIINSNYSCYTTWVDNRQNEEKWYRTSNNSLFAHGVYLTINPAYESIKEAQSNENVSSEDLIEKTEMITKKLIESADAFIQQYHEYCNCSMTEIDFIKVIEPLNAKINMLYSKQNDLSNPPIELKRWFDARVELAGTIKDFSLYYDKKNLDKWTTENRKFLMNSAIKDYQQGLDKISKIKLHK